MARQLVSENALLEILNAALQADADCADCRFTAVARLQSVDANGCNWSTPTLRCSGRPTGTCEPIARAVSSRIMQTHNLAP
jgi:hypothetical protein